MKHITNPKEITPESKELISDLDHDEIEFPVQEKDFSKIEVRNNICINVFGYENGLVFPIYVSDQKFKDYGFVAFNWWWLIALCVHQRF